MSKLLELNKALAAKELKGKELFKFLIEHKSELIAEKKEMTKYTDVLITTPEYFAIKGDTATKSAVGAPELQSADIVRVKVVANSALWCDSHMDVLMPDCWNKSIKERKGLIPHLHDHKHEIGAKVGKVRDIYSKDVPLSELGLLNKSGSTQALIFETDVMKSYNEMVFNQYKSGEINQHSIGLRYVRLDLAINNEESEKEYDFWNKYIDKVINKEQCIDLGFFWVGHEIMLLENSAVLFGSNILTPTLEAKSNDTEDAPPSGTHTPPSGSNTKDMFSALANTKVDMFSTIR